MTDVYVFRLIEDTRVAIKAVVCPYGHVGYSDIPAVAVSCLVTCGRDYAALWKVKEADATLPTSLLFSSLVWVL